MKTYFDTVRLIKDEPVVVNGMYHALKLSQLFAMQVRWRSIYCLLSQFHHPETSLSLACDTWIPSSNLYPRINTETQ